MILSYFIVTFILGWLIALFYIEVNKESIYLGDPELEELFITNCIGLLYACVFTLTWPLQLLYIILMKLVKAMIKKFEVKD